MPHKTTLTLPYRLPNNSYIQRQLRSELKASIIEGWRKLESGETAHKGDKYKSKIMVHYPWIDIRKEMTVKIRKSDKLIFITKIQ